MKVTNGGKQMETKESIQKTVYQAIADAFMMDVDQVANQPEKRLREDLGASSMQYLPLISTLEDTYNIEIDLHGFQNEARTIEAAVDYIYTACEKSQK